MVKNYRLVKQLSQIVKGSQELLVLSKLTKIVKIIQKFQICKRTVKLSRIVKNCQNVRSCFLITVIKCLKDHWSLGSLFNVKNKKWLSDSVSQWQGYLLSCQVTAKKTSQELGMLSNVTLYCQVTKIVMVSGSQLSVL